MHLSKFFALPIALAVATTVAVPPAAATEGTRSGLELRSRLPKDPVLAIVMTSDDLAVSFDELFETAARLSDEGSSDDLRRGLSDWESRMGFSVRDDLLAQIGPEFALVIDLPTPEEVMNALGDPTPENWSSLFHGIGKLAQVRDAKRLDDTLRKIFTAWKAEVGEAEELTRVTFSLGGEDSDTDPAFPKIPLYYGFRDDTFALGFSPEWVRASLDARPAGQRLDDGADFAKLAPHLDARPTGLFYLNLPKIAGWIRQSPMVAMLIASNKEAKGVADVFLTDEYFGMGLAATTAKADGGVKTTSFGPPGLSVGRLVGGAVAALAIPNLLSAIDRGKQKRTMADVRTIGIVCEQYLVDNETYPGPTDGWVPVEAIAEQVEPVYVRELPRNDGWGGPILFWSDGHSYRVVSSGKDGEMDQDWSQPFDARETADLLQDLVFGDGQFLAWPEGMAR